MFLGIAFNWGILLCWVAVQGSLSIAPVILYLAAICWTLFYDTIYAHQDIEDDALIGVKSTARLFADNTPRWLFGFQVAMMMLMLVAVLHPSVGMLENPNMVRLALVLGGIWAFGAQITWQMRRLDIHNTDVCMRLFRSNRDAGLILVAFWLVATCV